MKLPLILASFFILAWSSGAFAQPQKPAQPPSPDDALRVYRAGGLEGFGTGVEVLLRQELSQKKLNEPVIVRLATLRAFARYFAAVKPATPQEAKTLEWALKHPTLGPMLMTALSDRDNPARVLAVLTALIGAFGTGVEQCPDLTVATSVVWDTPVRENQTPQQADQAACDLFAHLIQNRRSLVFDPRDLPWPLLVYLVDSRVSPDERRWALQSYHLPQPAGKAYFDVKYDMRAFASGQWRGGDEQPYTLSNIKRLGGVCKDQAYFAAEICRAYGIPATVCTGQSGAGEGFHAWVGIFSVVNNAPRFDFATARYPEHGFWSGTVIDPQTGEKMSDHQAAMVAEWCQVTPARRLFSIALARSLDLLEPGNRIELSKSAIEAAPANRQAWMALAAECARPDASPTVLQDVARVVERFAVGRYDDFAFNIFTMLIASRPPAEQLTILDRMMGLFPRRPDLLSQIVLCKADALRQLSRPVDALKLYEQLLEQSLHYGPLVLDVMQRVDAMLRDAGRMRDLSDHYRIVWTNMHTPVASGYVWTTPWYIMGARFAKLLDETGQKDLAAKVREAIQTRDLSRHDRAPD